MRFLIFTLRILGFLLAIAIAIPVLAIALLQIPVGRTFVSNVASSLASTKEQLITIEELHIGFGLDASVARIAIADPQGIWLDLHNLAVDWAPLRLMSGSLDFETVTATQIDVNRTPIPATADATSTDADPSSFGLPFDITLGSLSISEINLGQQLLGAPVSLTAAGSGAAAVDPAVISANLDIQRIDGVDGNLLTKAEFEPAAGTLSFDIDVSEPRGGMAARLLDLPDLPALSLKLTGDGPLTDWAANLAIAVDGNTTVKGSAALSEIAETRHLTFDLDGDLASLAPPEAQAFLLGTTNATGNAVLTRSFEPQSGRLNLKTETVSLTAGGKIIGDVLTANADLTVNAGDEALIAVDLHDRRIAFGPLDARISMNGALTNAVWSTEINLASFQTSEARTGEISLTLSGEQADLTPNALTTPFDLTFAVQQLEGLTNETHPLSGPVSLVAKGQLDGAAQTARLAQVSLATDLATLNLNNTDVSLKNVSGQGKLALSDLGKLSGVAQRELGGSFSSSFAFDLDPIAVKGAADLSALTTDLQTGSLQADALLSGETRLDTTVTVNGLDDIIIKTIALNNDVLTLGGDAHYRPSDVVSDITLNLTDLARLDPQLEGALDIEMQTSGPIDSPVVTVDASSRQILLAGTPLDTLSFSAVATANIDAPTATIKSTASLNDQPLAIDVELKSENGGAEINPLSVALAGNKITGEIAVTDLQNPINTLRGDLEIDAPDLASLSPLALTDLGGHLQGTLKADPESKVLSLDMTGADLEIPSLSLGSLTLQANLAAPYNPQTITADLQIQDLITSATPVHNVKITAQPAGDGTALAAMVNIASGEDDGLMLKANLHQPTNDSYLLALNQLALTYQGIKSQLKQPTSIDYTAGTATIKPLELQLGRGSLSIAGQAGDTLDVKTILTNVPLDLANAFVPSLGLGGTLSGTATASGTAASPDANWSLTGSNLTARDLRANGLTALALSSTGTLANNQISQSTKVTGNGGLSLAADGTVGLDAPMALSFKLAGSIPTATLRRPLLEAGLRAEGSVSLSGSVNGTVNAPAYQITATPTSLKVISLSTGLTVQNIRGTAAVNQDQASLNGIVGDLATGGSLSASGRIGMKDDFQANLALALNKARYIDPGLVTAEVDADIKVDGPLASPSSSALIGGTITINKADVSIPESLPGSIPPVDVRHINASKAIRQQVAELGGEPSRSQKQQTSNPPRLDILISAPGRIFVRGRGLDAELAGNLKVIGTTDNPQAIGAFSLRRGQLDILNRRLVFSRGSATFEGSLTPQIDFAATTSVSETTITVTVSGQADDPEIRFSSAPELPQDEVLALLLFGKSVGNLSATQVAQLASAIATLTGGSDNGPLARIRKSLGLDAIDINTGGDNGPTVGVGKYINDNIYLGVEQGTGSNSSRVKVDIDLDRGVKVRGEVGADGSSKAGIFFEREY